jgi:hypothetical protein
VESEGHTIASRQADVSIRDIAGNTIFGGRVMMILPNI